MDEPKRTAPRWRITDWCGRPNYECNACPFATLDGGRIVAHVREKHPTMAEQGPAAADPLVGIVFASDAAETEARKLGLDREAFGAHSPTGATGYVLDDVRRIARSVTPTTE